MANSYVTFSTNSGSPINEYTIPFNFLNPENIKVLSVRSAIFSIVSAQTLNWSYIPEANWNSNLVNGQTTYSFGNYTVVFENGVNKIKFSPAVGVSPILTYTITIYRRTSAINNTFFSNGSPIQASDLNAVLLQSLYNSEEALDAVDSINTVNISTILSQKLDKSGGTLTGAIVFSPANSISNVTSLTTTSGGAGITTSQISLLGGTIKNVPTPALSTDVANKAYVDSVGGNGGNGGAVTITDDSITSAFLRKVVGQEAVTTETIRTSAVTDVKIASNAVTNNKIATSAVTSAKINTGAVTTEKLDTNAVTSVAINSGAVTEDKIGTGAVTTIKLATSSVTNDKIATGTIGSDKLASGSFDGESLFSNNSIPYTKLKDFLGSWAFTILNLTYNTINFTGTFINAFSASFIGKSFFEKTPLSNNDTTLLNEGRLILKSGSIKPFFGVSANTLTNLNGMTPAVEILSPASGDGYYSYNIVVKNSALLGKLNGITIMKWQDRVPGDYPQYGSGQLGNVKPTFFYKTISNIPFNYVIENENPEISLSGTPVDPLTTSGLIQFNNVGQQDAKKYLITLNGSAQCTTSTGILYLKPISDSYYPTDNGVFVPKSVARLAFDAIQYRVFNITTVLNVAANNSISFPVQYYYTDNLNSAPTANTIRGFGRGADYLIANGQYSTPPATWKGDALNRWNESIVDLIIQRIK